MDGNCFRSFIDKWLYGGNTYYIDNSYNYLVIQLFIHTNKGDDYWEREYSKLWKNLSDFDKLKTVGKIVHGVWG